MFEHVKKNLYNLYFIAEEFLNSRFPGIAGKEKEKLSAIIEVMKIIIELKKLERISK
ncbi:MAG: hypothetical protein J7K98_00570 [Candidatus Aenigmarchaeota archaeon]|nr:hypothetical protein [Candidatus Aenigmarchaeota archaeon]